MSQQYGGQGAELVPGTLRGYRQWQPAAGGALAALSMSYVWMHSEVEAICLKVSRISYRNSYDDPIIEQRAGVPQHVVPDLNCVCGIYAKHQPDNYSSSGYVSGVIEAWGKVQLGSEGFRAQKARIVALAMPNIIIRDDFAEFMRILGKRYKGVEFWPDVSAMYEKYPPIDVSALLPPPEPGFWDFWKMGSPP